LAVVVMTIAFDWKGLDPLVLLEAGVTVSNGVVRVPYFDVGGKQVNAKLFGGRGPWWEHAGRGVSLFGLEQLGALGKRHATIILAEGESDALAIRGAVAVDFDGSPVVTLGVPGASAWQPAWRSLLQRFWLVHIVPDGDDAGSRMANRILQDIPWARLVRLPEGVDARSLIQEEDGVRRFLDLLDEADVVAHLDAAMRLGTPLHALRSSERRWAQ
jgi:DNA primase